MTVCRWAVPPQENLSRLTLFVGTRREQLFPQRLIRPDLLCADVLTTCRLWWDRACLTSAVAGLLYQTKFANTFFVSRNNFSHAISISFYGHLIGRGFTRVLRGNFLGDLVLSRVYLDERVTSAFTRSSLNPLGFVSSSLLFDVFHFFFPVTLFLLHSTP